ncbi:MAG: nitrite reductase [Campylobacteraceae bacterium]|nr:nitrite reductase [Campylobacteraceae bacterium]MBT3883041.1 nitrite reductase [Campylobacteraceae bacterium]MBT4030701.1 nitrite reductase [Campylobacteraceae bacterium]MBT4178610.1 nitrite reductase [Campylobacteraceae bacterium]MBT4572672.1 nitrite reductase [Campylobacteraceae bacterium]
MQKISKVLLGLALTATTLLGYEKYFVVERESESLAVIENGIKYSKIENMHNMNHGVVKFEGKDGYVISRDGFVVKFDPVSEKILGEYKTSKSAIGFVIGKHYVAVANYDDQSVDILDRDLNPIKKIKTHSKNVGIKIYKNYLIFAQMENDTISIYKDMSLGKGKADFQVHKEFKDVGELPFDAMIQDNKYIVGFFTSKHFGTVDLDTMTYKKVKIFLDETRKMVLKVPHFGFWSIGGDKVFVPAVGDNKVLVYDMNFNFVQNIETEGMPVFTALSPDKKHLAVTYSGKKFPVIQIIDTKTLKIIKRFEFKGKVLHVRWSNTKPHLYVAVNDENIVAVLDTNEWYRARDVLNIDKPSGIFIYNAPGHESPATSFQRKGRKYE